MSPIVSTDLPPDLQRNLISRTLFRGEILFQQGEKATFLYLVVTGQMRLVSFVNQQMVTLNLEQCDRQAL